MSQRVIILGAGESGVGAALLAMSQGLEVFVSDSGAISEKYKKELSDSNIAFEEKRHSKGKILKSDVVVKSPGIPEGAPLIQKIRKKGIPVISEIEFASRHTDGKIIAITGSNGKSTTTSLTHHIFQKAGLNVGIAGNIGHSFARMVADGGKDYYVLEVSSFQLDDIVSFHPKTSILLNITPDHLDRYNNDFDQYVQSKFRITENQTSQDHFIYCSDDEVIEKYIEKYQPKAQLLPFGLKKKSGNVGYTTKEKLIINHKNQLEMSITNLSLKGTHNMYNSLAAGIAARTFDIKKDVIRESMTDFKGLEHRLEHVAKIGGVEYINDSKATNVNSTWYALESMNKPVIWIAGGVDKGNDYEVLQNLVKQKVRAIVCLGENNLRIHEAFSRHVDLIVNTMSANEAVRIAHHLADKEDCVLLSPACASFDLFENYEDRGNQFRSAVRNL